MIDKSWLNKKFLPSKIPNWKCPICNSSSLSVDGKFYEKPSDRLQKMPNSYFYESTGEESPFFEEVIEGIKTIFTGFLKCYSKNCGAYVTISGYVSTDKIFYEDSLFGITNDLENFYYPLLFHPPLNYIENTNLYNTEIQYLLKDCYRLYWIDNSACANKIRTIVELLLDRHKIPRKSKVKKGFKSLKLHDRLELYEKKKPDIAALFMSIKWIGNTGSHSDTLSNQQVLDSFDLLSLVLNKIYLKETQKLEILSKKINKIKRPI